MSQTSAFTYLWESAVTKFPELAKKWGRSLPLDQNRNIITEALNEAKDKIEQSRQASWNASQVKQPVPAPPPTPATVPPPVPPPVPTPEGDRGGSPAAAAARTLGRFAGRALEHPRTQEAMEPLDVLGEAGLSWIGSPFAKFVRPVAEKIPFAKTGEEGGMLFQLSSPEGLARAEKGRRWTGDVFREWLSKRPGTSVTKPLGSIRDAEAWSKMVEQHRERPTMQQVVSAAVDPSFFLAPLKGGKIASTIARPVSKRLADPRTTKLLPKVSADDVAREVKEVASRTASSGKATTRINIEGKEAVVTTGKKPVSGQQLSLFDQPDPSAAPATPRIADEAITPTAQVADEVVPTPTRAVGARTVAREIPTFRKLKDWTPIAPEDVKLTSSPHRIETDNFEATYRYRKKDEAERTGWHVMLKIDDAGESVADWPTRVPVGETYIFSPTKTELLPYLRRAESEFVAEQAEFAGRPGEVERRLASQKRLKESAAADISARRATDEADPTAPTPVQVEELGDTVFHGTRGGSIESFVDTDGNLVLNPSTNFEGKQVGVSFTGDRGTSVDYATRFSAGEAGGAIAARRQRGGLIFEIDKDAIPNKLFLEADDELATRGTSPVVIPKGRFKVSAVDEMSQSKLQIFEREGISSVRALSNRELGKRELTSTIKGEIAENAAGGEYSGWFTEGRTLTQDQLDIADRFGFEAVDDPLAPFIGREIVRRMEGKSPDELTALFKELAEGAEDLPTSERNAPFFYGPDFETHFRKSFTDELAAPTTAAPTTAKVRLVGSYDSFKKKDAPKTLKEDKKTGEEVFTYDSSLYAGEKNKKKYWTKSTKSKKDLRWVYQLSDGSNVSAQDYLRAVHPEFKAGDMSGKNAIGKVWDRLPDIEKQSLIGTIPFDDAVPGARLVAVEKSRGTQKWTEKVLTDTKKKVRAGRQPLAIDTLKFWLRENKHPLGGVENSNLDTYMYDALEEHVVTTQGAITATGARDPSTVLPGAKKAIGDYSDANLQSMISGGSRNAEIYRLEQNRRTALVEERSRKVKKDPETVPDVDEPAEEVISETSVADSVKSTAAPHELDTTVSDNAPNIQKSLEEAVSYIQEGKLESTGYKGHYTRKMKNIAKELFGNESKESLKRVDDYVRHINKEAPDVPPKLEDYFHFNEETQKWVPILGKVPPTKAKGTKSLSSERSSALKKDEIAPVGGEPVANIKGPMSDWVKEGDFAVTLKNTAEKIDLKEVATPWELGDTTRLWKFKAKPIDTLLRRMFGKVNSHTKILNSIRRNSTDEFKDLGWSDKNGRIIESALGTHENPGIVRLIWYALNDKDTWLKHVEEWDRVNGGNDGVRHYNNLRTLTDWESSYRWEADQIKEGLKQEDYFYRGMYLDVGTMEDVKKNVPSAWPNLGRAASFQLKRNKLGFPDMLKLGFRPLSWNPYEQSIISATQGMKHRMQIDLLDTLKDEALGLTHLVSIKDINKIDELIKEGWVTVEHLGPAFKPENIKISKARTDIDQTRQIDQLGTKEIKEVVSAEDLQKQLEKADALLGDETNGYLAWMVPKDIAKALDNAFGPPDLIRKAFRKELRIPRIGYLKADDVVYIPKRMKLFMSLFQQYDFSFRAGAYGVHGSYGAIRAGVTDIVRSVLDEGLSHEDTVKAVKEAFLDMLAPPAIRKKGIGELPEGRYTRAASMLPRPLFHVGMIPKSWFDMARANISPKFRIKLADLQRNDDPWFSAETIAQYPEHNLEEYTWKAFFDNGLPLTDNTILGRDQAANVVTELAVEKGLIRSVAEIANAPRWIKAVHGAAQRGLFDGTYPAAIMHDVRYNLFPIVKATHPTLNPQQIMGIVARQVGEKWSVMPEHMSYIQGAMRSALERNMFSLNEFESQARQLEGMFRGPHKLFWAEHWASVFTFTIVAANLIHFTTTSLIKRQEDGEWELDLNVGELIPRDRYIPFNRNDYYTLGYGYNSEFMSPDIPVVLRDDRLALIDLLNQFDLMFRMLDGAYGLPIAGLVRSRSATLNGAIWTQVQGDFRGRDVGKHGYAQRIAQFAYDLGAPIGAGQFSLQVFREQMKDVQAPEISIPGSVPVIGDKMLVPPVPLESLLPTSDTKIGIPGAALESTGPNVRAPSTKTIRNDMVKNVFSAGDHPDYPGLILTSWADLKKHKHAEILASIVYNDHRNYREIKELEQRRNDGYKFADDFSKMTFAVSDEYSKRLRLEWKLVEDYFYKRLMNQKNPKPWEPQEFSKKLTILTANTRSAINAIKQKEGIEDPWITKRIQEQEAEPDRSKEPLEWAIWKFIDLRKDYIDPITGQTDYKMKNPEYKNMTYEEAWEYETSNWDDEEMKETGGLKELLELWLVQKSFAGTRHPFIQKRFDEMNKLDEAGYWSDGDDPLKTTEEGDILEATLISLGMRFPNSNPEEIWRGFLLAPASERRMLRSSSNRVISETIKSMERARRVHRYDTIINNPELDRVLIFWFGNIPYLSQNLDYYQSLYFKKPSGIRRRQ